MDSAKSPAMDSPTSPTTHKTLKQKVDRLDSTVTALPQAFTEYMESFGAFCLTGIKLASLLETLFQDTPVLLLALRFREACEQLGDKCSKSSLFLKQELVPPVKKFGPTLGHLRSRVENHAKVLSKYESSMKQLEGLKSSSTSNKSKQEQAETKVQNSAEDYARADSKLAEALNEVDTMRIEVMGSCFLSFLENQSKLLTSASDIMAPIGSYKQIGKGLFDSPSNSTVKEATLGWLAAAQSNHNLRSFRGLSRNDVQCMLYNQRDGLPSTIRNGLNQKVDALLKTYASELQRSPHTEYKVLGGFHLNPKGIEIALKDCCTELESRGAGAAHAQTRADRAEQVERDVSRTSYRIQGELFGCATGDQVTGNIIQKQEAVSAIIQSLPLCTQPPGVSKSKVEEMAFHVLNDSCTTVTNTAAKTAVQLVFGKANLVMVRPSPLSKDNRPVELTPRNADSSVQLVVRSSWWLVEDYAAFSMLYRQVEPTDRLGTVDVVYTINFTLSNFLKEDSPPELPTIALTYRQQGEQATHTTSSPARFKEKTNPVSRTILSLLRKGNPRHAELLTRSSKSSFRSYTDKDEDESSGDSRQSPAEKSDLSRHISTSSTESDGLETPITTSHIPYVPSYALSSRSEGLKGSRAHHHHHHHPLRRRGSNESMSSQSTLVRREPYEELDTGIGIMDMIGNEIGRGYLTESRINAHVREENMRHNYRRGDDYDEAEVYPVVSKRRRPRHRTGELMVTPEHEGMLCCSRDGSLMLSSGGSSGTRQLQVSPEDGFGGSFPKRGAERAPPTSDNSSSGSSGIGIESSFRESREPIRSRSTSMSPVGSEVERNGDTRNGNGSVDSGINLPPPQQHHRLHEESKKRQSKEVLDFSAGFGQIINSGIQGERYDMLGESVDYKMGDFYKAISDDESENSTRLSIPPLSSPSSGAQSPLLRTKSAENISSIERSSSRISTHSMPYGDLGGGQGSTTSIDELRGVNFNHAPGGYVPPRRVRHSYSDYEYDDRLSQDSVNGSGRGSLSQGSHDEWEWGHPPHREGGYPMDYRGPYDYGAPPPMRPQVPSYDSPHLPHDRPRPIHHGRDEYSPSPAAGHMYDRGFRPPPPQMMSGGPWQGPPNFDPGRMRPGPPISMSNHHPPPPMGDRGFRPVVFRPNTPSDAPSPVSLPSMSPAPSPRATPPPTPPPYMGHHGPHPLPGPPPRGPHMGPPPSHMGGPPHARMRPPPPRHWEGGPRDFPPPHAPRPMMGPGPPPPMGPSPGGPPRYPPPDWSERPW